MVIVEIVEGFKQICDIYGGDKIFYYGGGGQGNYFGGVYSGVFLKVLGLCYWLNVLVQEKIGEVWVDFQLYGGYMCGEFENVEVLVFVGKNLWMLQSFLWVWVVFNEIVKDFGWLMIVIDFVVIDIVKMVDFYLWV